LRHLLPGTFLFGQIAGQAGRCFGWLSAMIRSTTITMMMMVMVTTMVVLGFRLFSGRHRWSTMSAALATSPSFLQLVNTLWHCFQRLRFQSCGLNRGCRLESGAALWTGEFRRCRFRHYHHSAGRGHRGRTDGDLLGGGGPSRLRLRLFFTAVRHVFLVHLEHQL
jgi:hypothetical protein